AVGGVGTFLGLLLRRRLFLSDAPCGAQFRATVMNVRRRRERDCCRSPDSEAGRVHLSHLPVWLWALACTRRAVTTDEWQYYRSSKIRKGAHCDRSARWPEESRRAEASSTAVKLAAIPFN